MRAAGIETASNPQPRIPHGFTLVEMLVVITIIGILASLITAAAVTARRRAKIAVVASEVNQLDMALKAYKEKFGEYPPDFCGLDGSLDTDTTNYPIRAAAQNAVLRHLARAFPRYRPGVSKNWAHTGWAGFLDDLSTDPNASNPNLAGWGLNVSATDPDNAGVLSGKSALTFWLGGRPEWLVDTTGSTDVVQLPSGNNVLKSMPVKEFQGFSANPANPFDRSASRIQPFFEFNLTCLSYSTSSPGGISVWPSSACDQNGQSPIIYFRANSSTYFQETSTIVKKCGVVCAAIDTRLSTNVPGRPSYDSSKPATTVFTWVNPSSFQVFSSGLDVQYAALSPSDPAGLTDRLYFPTGDNYAPETYDDITNFSGGGTLEDRIP